uniref:Uncharacterized protein n=1 Tax=Anguilla anguilla TaxID=7936 RepID=A0A0E9R1M4_ANGAN
MNTRRDISLDEIQ